MVGVLESRDWTRRVLGGRRLRGGREGRRRRRVMRRACSVRGEGGWVVVGGGGVRKRCSGRGYEHARGGLLDERVAGQMRSCLRVRR